MGISGSKILKEVVYNYQARKMLIVVRVVRVERGK